MATPTLAVLTDRVRKLLVDPAGDGSKWSDGQIADALNWAQMQVVADNLDQEAFRAGATYSVAAGAVSFPAGVHGRVLATLVSGTPAVYRLLSSATAAEMDRDCPGWRVKTGTPTHFVAEAATTGWTYRLYPAPTDLTATLELRWSAVAEELTTGDDVPVVLLMVAGEFDLLLLPSGAASWLLNEESGAEDAQVQKFMGLFGQERVRYAARLTQLMVGAPTVRAR